MPSCAVCTHPERKAIDRALLSNESERGVAGRFDLAKSSVARHKTNHLAAKVQAANEAEPLSTRAQIAKLLERAIVYLDRCESNDSRNTPAMYAETRRCMESIAKLNGEMPTMGGELRRFLDALGMPEAEARSLIEQGRAIRETSDGDLDASVVAAVPGVIARHPERRAELLERWFGMREVQA